MIRLTVSVVRCALIATNLWVAVKAAAMAPWLIWIAHTDRITENWLVGFFSAAIAGGLFACEIRSLRAEGEGK